MIDASLPLQAAVVAALKADAALTAIVTAKVYDRPPASAVAPYTALTGWQVIEDGTDCSDAAEILFEIQCYSTGVGRPESARMATAVAAALHGLRPALAGFSEAEILHQSTLYFTETDGLTTRAVVSFQVLVDSD